MDWIQKKLPFERDKDYFCQFNKPSNIINDGDFKDVFSRSFMNSYKKTKAKFLK